jgi:hypothetical protein
LKRVSILAVAGLLLASCVSEPAQERKNGLAGTWFAHDPPVSEGIRLEVYLCLGETGEYDFISLSTREALGLDEVHGIQRTHGSWTRKEDTLKVMETEVGSIIDTSGIERNWMLNMKMNPLIHSSSIHFQIRMDTLFIHRLNGEIGIATRRAPHELIKSVCPGF